MKFRDKNQSIFSPKYTQTVNSLCLQYYIRQVDDYLHNILLNHMRFINKFNFATNIAVISGNSKNDKTAARLIQFLKANSKTDLRFVGVLSENNAHLLDECYASSSILDHEEIVINRNYNESIQESFFNPYRALTHYKNHQLIKILKEKNFYGDLISNKTSAVITVGNFSLMSRLYENLNQAYSDSKTIKPLRLGFDTSIAHRKVDNEQFLDYLYYNLPQRAHNLSKYTFPSQCIAYESVFSAFQYLQKFKQDPTNDSFKFKEFSYEISELVNKARSQYRIGKGISQDTYITLLAPGNQEKQVKFFFKSFNNALKNFSARPNVSGIDSQFFRFAILLPEDERIASMIKSQAVGISSKYEIQFIEPKDKYGAMAASDFGLLHSGEVTVEAAAFQLPATVVSSMSNYKAYLTYLYNGHESPLNVSTNQEGYQDLLGSLTAIGEKIATLMVDHFERPKLRFYYVKLYREEIQKMLMLNGKNPEMKVSKTGLMYAAEDILEKVQLYESMNPDEKMWNYQRKERLNCV